MKQSTVWIDHKKARIFIYLADGIHEKIIDVHTHHEKPSKEDLKKFYHDVAVTLAGSDKIYILGPGNAKEEFKNHCEDHHQNVNKAILKIEAMKDHPTSQEILEASTKFFKHQQAWSGV
jgi:stalled ribosome rescue protein Dom34